MESIKKLNIRQMTLAAILAAIVCVATYATSIPVPLAGGFIHLGDSMILISAILFGPVYGLIAGGIGSMFANFFMGAFHWAPFTLVIKGLMGFAAGKIADYHKGNTNVFSVRNLLSVLVCASILIVGYFFAAIILLDWTMAVAGIGPNIIQAGGGAVIYFALSPIIGRVIKGLNFDKLKT